MKLGLLVALAVAAVVAGLSDGHNFTDCELRAKLASVIVLPSYLQRYKESILAAVICKVKLMSQLNSGLVTVKGTCTTTPEPTTPEPTTPEPTTPEPTTPETTTPEPTTPETTTPEPTTPEPTTPEPTTPEPTTPETTTPEPTTPEPTTPEPTTPEPTTPEPTTPETTTPETTTPETTTPEPTTPETTTTASIIVGKRRKRSVPIKREEPSNLDKVLEQLVQSGHVNLLREEDYSQCNRMGGRVDSHEDDSHEDDSHDDDSHDDDSQDDESHEEENGKGGGTRPSCLGFYGLFQLSDSCFCESGYRPSKNMCGKTCTAFADDNIVDDINCLVKTNYWWYLLENTPGFCFNSRALVSTCGV